MATWRGSEDDREPFSYQGSNNISDGGAYSRFPVTENANWSHHGYKQRGYKDDKSTALQTYQRPHFQRHGEPEDTDIQKQSKSMYGGRSKSRYSDNWQPKDESVPEPMSFEKLQSISRMQPDQLLQLIVQKRKGFIALLESRDLTEIVLHFMVKIICQACKSQFTPKSRLKLLNEVLASGFLMSGLSSYISNVHQKEPSSHSMSVKNMLSLCISLLESMLNSFPSSLPDVMVVFASIDLCYKRNVGLMRSVTGDTDLGEKIGEFQKIIDKMTQEYQKNQRRVKNSVEDLKKPPNDFREISVFPQKNDIYLSDQPFIRANKDTGGYQNLEHYLDVQFRLLREDFVAPLRDGIMQYTEAQQSGENRPRNRDIRLYSDVHVKHSICTEDSGLVHCIQFNTRPLRRIKWDRSKRLIYGSLLCLSSDNFQTMLFASVVDRKNDLLEEGILYVKFEAKFDMVAAIKPSESFMMAESSAFFEAYKHVLYCLQSITDDMPFQDYIVHCDIDVKPPRYLRKHMEYDFQSILACPIEPITGRDPLRRRLGGTCFIPVLDLQSWPTADSLMLDNSQMEALQTSLTKEFIVIQGPPGTGKTYIGLKIAKILLENKTHWSVGKNCPMFVVCYTNHALDQFLDGIVRFNTNVIRVGGRCQNDRLKEYNIKHFTVQQKYGQSIPALVRQGIQDSLKAMKNLDTRLIQRIAALKATYIGVLSENKLKEYISEEHLMQLTVHVPRKFQQNQHQGYCCMILEWLGLGSVKNMIPRELSNPLNWRAQQIVETEVDEEDNVEIAEDAKQETYSRMLDFGDLQGAMEKYEQIEPDSDGLVLTLKQLNMPYEKLCRMESENVCVFDAEEMKLRYEWLLNGLHQATVENTDKCLWKLKMEDRWKLYRIWIHAYRNAIEKEIKATEQKFQLEQERLAEMKNQKDSEIMRKADVIGMTTTGAARYWHVLQQIQPKIIIVEEAAEVLESHIVTTLSPGCEHLILIGDHKQLRPSPTVYELAKRYKLDLSLFERMVNNGVKCNTLEIQHRMRPEIASMVLPIYPELKNHDSVMQYENIKGVGKNIYFIDHNEEEALHEDNQSRSNEHEARYLAALCKYFLLQGYSPQQITVLTTYSGQLFEIRKFMPKAHFEGVRLCVVDNYQGEENDIILLSLVRSNKQNSIGFLKTENRVCVALSRAKKGFFIIGNLTLLANQADLWSEILQILRKQNSVGPFLELYCNNHPVNKIQARIADDFKKAPEGGCLEPCEFRLMCGHVCIRICHIIDSDHKKYQCPKPCLKHCEKGDHPCPKKCAEDCGKCQVIIEKNCPKCNFTHSVPCHFEFKEDDLDFQKYKCTQPCPRTLCDKNHLCPKECHEKCETQCSFMLEKNCPKCNFIHLVPCFFEFKEGSLSYDKYKCKRPCSQILCEKDHLCPKKCFEQCDKCFVKVLKEDPNCYHVNSVPCCFNFENTKYFRGFEYKCRQSCKKECEIGHSCLQQCWETCKCQIIVNKNCPKCDENKEVPCHFDFTCPLSGNDDDYEKYKCTQPCIKKLCENGHLCPEKCWKDCDKECSYLVEKENPACHHRYEVPCSFMFSAGQTLRLGQVSNYLNYKKKLELYKCQVMVEKENPLCHHIYKVPCYFEFPKYVSRLSVRLGALLGALRNQEEKYHQCLEPCGKILCDNDHTCQKKCHEECGKCMVMMKKENPKCHHINEIPCSTPIASYTCKENCERTLDCGHGCTELCGFSCTKKCTGRKGTTLWPF